MASRRPKPIQIFSVNRDNVVDALVATARTDYSYALEKLVPLINQLKIQRRIQNPRFYDRLARDIVKRCVMPAITLAFVHEDHGELEDADHFQRFVTTHIGKAFVLDGIQRLSTLERAHEQAIIGGDAAEFPLDQPLFLNILVCRSTDNLLYRMITLNNGQRPMTTRHQIEILTSNLFEGDSESIFLVKEKDSIRREQGVFSRGDFVLGYMAFLSNSITVDSQKLIQEKLDELLANKILEHDPTEGGIEFYEVMALIAELTKNKKVDKWFKVVNNLIGFCASIRGNFQNISVATPDDFEEFIEIFEEAFKAFNVAKIKLSRARRAAVAFAIENFDSADFPNSVDLTNDLVSVIE